MSFSSLPSKKAVVVDIPEPTEFKAYFVYKHFTPDERTNSNQSLTDPARHIVLTWLPVTNGTNPELIPRYSIKDNQAKVQSERLISTGDFSSVVFQDTGIDNKMAFYVKKALEVLVPGSRTSANSSLEHARSLDKATNTDVSLDFLANALQQSPGVTFGSNQPTVLERLKEVGVRVQVNSKLLHKALVSVQEDVTTPFADEVLPLLDQSKEVQTHAQTSKSSQVLSAEDYDYEIKDYVSTRNVDPQHFDPILQPIGYIVDKWEVDLEQGTTTKVESLILENPRNIAVIDYKVKYGCVYLYSIRAVAFFEVQATDSTGNQLVAVGFLVGSKPSPTISVTAIENVAPPPPADFNLAWDYQNRCARITWSFPPTSQRDIKKFQIFRRRNVSEPFELVRMFDFDDSTLKTKFNENPDPLLVETLTTPKNFFFDKEFTKDTTWIYALCCIDAHGLSSNYSMQLEGTFDRFSNKLKKKLISVAGAPKAYPNAFLNTDTFVDTIKDEGHTKLTIYFDPEFIKVTDNKKNDVGLLKMGDLDLYQFQVLNLDLQKQEVLSFQLQDRRNSTSINS